MSVIVKCMEMPRNCYECPMESANWCNILDKRVESIDRLQDCPLVEIPPHGRMIDADKVIATHKVGNWDLHKVLAEAPTIIEEEE